MISRCCLTTNETSKQYFLSFCKSLKNFWILQITTQIYFPWLYELKSSFMIFKNWRSWWRILFVPKNIMTWDEIDFFLHLWNKFKAVLDNNKTEICHIFLDSFHNFLVNSKVNSFHIVKWFWIKFGTDSFFLNFGSFFKEFLNKPWNQFLHS